MCLKVADFTIRQKLKTNEVHRLLVKLLPRDKGLN